MPANSIPVPAALAKHGLRSVSDNIPEGQYLDIRSSFIQVFRPELEARLLRKKGKPCATETRSPCRSGK